MEIAASIDQARYNVFRWRYELSIPKKLTLAICLACLTGLLSQARIILPWSPVPVTGQTFAVLLAGVFLGRWWGGASMAIYALLGFAGVPWFSGGASGFGATGGYIFGFILATLLLGHFTDKYVRSRGFLSMLGLMLSASLILIYVPGLIWLGLWLNLVKGSPATFASLLTMGLIPFLAGDVIKAVLAAAVAKEITPKKAYTGVR
jgi:biotin transport system substrate-specific component